MFMLSEAWHRQVPISDFLSAKKHIQYFWISKLICTFVVLVWDSLVLFRNTGWVVSSSMGHILCAAFAALGVNH